MISIHLVVIGRWDRVAMGLFVEASCVGGVGLRA